MMDNARLEALSLAYQSAAERMPQIDFPRFVRYMEKWDVYPIHVDHCIVGAVLTYEAEIHACINDGYGKWLSRRVLKDTLEKILDEYGYATTCAFTDAGRKFVDRLGFVEMEPGQYVKVKKHGHC